MPCHGIASEGVKDYSAAISITGKDQKNKPMLNKTKKILFLTALQCVWFISFITAQETVVYANGSLGVGRDYVSVGGKYYRHRSSIISFEIGGGLMGVQNETAGSATSLTGQNGFESSISSSLVIAPDPNVPDHMYAATIKTRFTGEFFRGSYEWRFPSKKETSESRPIGLRFGIEFAYFDIIQRQTVEFRSLTGADAYDYNGTAHAVVLAPGLRLGYDLLLFKNLLISPEIATPLYIPVGNHAKTNGPFGKEAAEIRLGIGWFIR
jgi:hypothetical protein